MAVLRMEFWNIWNICDPARIRAILARAIVRQAWNCRLLPEASVPKKRDFWNGESRFAQVFQKSKIPHVLPIASRRHRVQPFPAACHSRPRRDKLQASQLRA